tara:strand:+ start:3271 stop:3987 length:717 start_codon:yes stop_codon:yes gene_type:complete
VNELSNRLKGVFERGRITGNDRPRETESAARISQRYAGVFAVVSLAEAFVIVALVVMIVNLFPLIRYYPVTLSVQDNQFVEVKPVFETETAAKLAKESFVRDYILRREKLDLLTDVERWNWVRDHSEPAAVWKPFYEAMHHKKVWEDARDADETWDVSIRAAYPAVTNDEDRWVVEFTRQRYRTSKKFGPPEGWVATIELGRLSQPTTNRAELLTNPLRLAVRTFHAYEKNFLEKGGK